LAPAGSHAGAPANQVAAAAGSGFCQWLLRGRARGRPSPAQKAARLELNCLVGQFVVEAACVG
jgi:hypothetical protein